MRASTGRTDAKGTLQKLRVVKLPVVDLSAENAADQLASACSLVGFQCIINHGVELECSRSVENLETFFRTSSPERRHSVRRNHCGYGPGLQLAEHMEAERYSTVHGGYGTYAREDYVIVNPSIDAHKERQDPYYAGPAGAIWYQDGTNRFPDDAFRDAQLSHYRALEQLGDRLMRLAGEALTNDAGAFAHVTRRHTSNVVVGYHAAGTGVPGGAQTMIKEHSDTGLMTLIQYGSNGMCGLEVKDHLTGEWLAVDPADWPPGALLLNIGDSMHRLSNGRMRQPAHTHAALLAAFVSCTLPFRCTSTRPHRVCSRLRSRPALSTRIHPMQAFSPHPIVSSIGRPKGCPSPIG